MLKRWLCGVWLCFGVLCGGAVAQAPSAAPHDPFASLHFLEGVWTANGSGQGAVSYGTYTFGREMGGHVLARHGKPSNCSGPANFDCEHRDLLYVYVDGPGQPLKAIYFDSEGHVIHYGVTTPDPATVEFLSEPGGRGPQARLVYTLKGGVMSGKFQMQMPGATAWQSYLEWTGTRAN